MKEKSLSELYACTQEQMKANLQASRFAFDHAPTKGEATEASLIVGAAVKTFAGSYRIILELVYALIDQMKTTQALRSLLIRIE